MLDEPALVFMEDADVSDKSESVLEVALLDNADAREAIDEACEDEKACLSKKLDELTYVENVRPADEIVAEPSENPVEAES
jgi:hypothetical protein